MKPNIIRTTDFVGNLKAHRYRSMLDYVSQHNCNNILEIGTHKGHTAAELIRHSSNKNVNYYGIDVFLGKYSNEIEMNEISIKPDSIEEVYNFLHGYSNNVYLFEGYSKDMLSKISEMGIMFDLIWIDGGHSYETVKCDFEKSIDLLSNNGIMFFDDYTEEKYPIGNTLPLAVKLFIDELINENKYKITILNDYVDEYRGYTYRIVSLMK